MKVFLSIRTYARLVHCITKNKSTPEKGASVSTVGKEEPLGCLLLLDLLLETFIGSRPIG